MEQFNEAVKKPDFQARSCGLAMPADRIFQLGFPSPQCAANSPLNSPSGAFGSNRHVADIQISTQRSSKPAALVFLNVLHEGLGGWAVNDLNFIAIGVSERGECSTPELLLWQAGELYASCGKLLVLLMNVRHLKRPTSTWSSCGASRATDSTTSSELPASKTQYP